MGNPCHSFASRSSILVHSTCHQTLDCRISFTLRSKRFYSPRLSVWGASNGICSRKSSSPFINRVTIFTMTVTTTPPPLQAPTAKEKKYDRQLRLWAASGQRALEESHILLLIADRDGAGSGSSVAGVETLKNLVLPGIGSFTIADSAKVTEADLGVNFFLEAESLGRSRADECRRLLEELNPDVSGHAVSVVRSTTCLTSLS